MLLLKGIVIGFGTILLSLTLLLSLSFSLLLGSQMSREWFVQDLLPNLIESDSIELKVEGFNSPDSNYWSFRRLSFSINNQKLFDAKMLIFAFKLSSLFDKKLDITVLSADSLSVSIPSNEVSDEETPSSQNWQDSFIPVRIQKLELKHVALEGLIPKLPVFQAIGKAELLWQSSLLTSELSIQTKNSPAAYFNLQANLNTQFSGTIHAKIQETAGGWLGKTLKLPTDHDVDLDLSLSAKVSEKNKEQTIWELHTFRMPWQKHKIKASGKGLWSSTEDKLHLSKLSLFVDDKEQTLSGWWQGELIELNIALDELPIDLADDFQTYISGGIISGTLLAQGHIDKPAIKTNLQATTQYKNKAVSISLKGEGDLSSFNVESALLKLSQAQLKTSGNIFIDKQTLDLQIHQLSGPLRTIELFDIELPKELSININEAQGNLKGPIISPIYNGYTQANGSFNGQNFSAKTKFQGDVDKVNITDFFANISEGVIGANGLLDWENDQLNLRLKASNIPSKLAAAVQIDIPAQLSAHINSDGHLTGSFSLPHFNGDASAVGKFKETQFEITSLLISSSKQVEVSKLSAKLIMVRQNQPPAVSTIDGAGIFSFASKNLEAKVNIQALPYEVMTLAGIDMPKNLSGTLNANLSTTGALPFPKVYGSINSDGILEDEPFSFSFTGSQKDQSLFFDDTKIIWNDTLLKANGAVSKEKLDLHVRLETLKLTDLNKFGFNLKPGNVDLHFNLLGTLDAPQLDGLIKLAVKNLDKPDAPDVAKGDIIVTSSFSTKNNTLVINSDVKHGSESKGQLLLRSHFKPFLDWLINGQNKLKLTELPLDIFAKGNIGLTWINHFIDRDIQNISGKLNLDAKLEGSLQKPRLQGSLELSNGIYVNSLSQTSIENAEIQLAFDEKSINIVKATATDGHTGKIELLGKIDLADSDNGLIDITLSLHKASVIRREDIEGDASGSIQLSGDFKELLLKGDINVAPFQIMLDLIPSDSIPEIEVELKEESKTAHKGTIQIPLVGLNINISVEQQAYIRGRGLDAELQGKLMLTGSLNKPNYNGRFKVIRGSFDLFAKTFKLEEGDVLFSNDAVSLFVQGKHRGKDYTFIASLSGTLDDLKIGLRTEPVLPEDEALARLLFGRSVRNITPFQAIQLATAIQTLRGEGSKFDPLGTARDILHVDSITIESQETNEGNGIAVGLGKYITEGVYVEIVRTPEPTQPWKGTVEVELTPRINLETTTGGSSGFGGVELQWKKDY